ncbi:DUF3806 domain-containing protein [Corynebacterium halotolerans]|uniref:DUF3806 domain-containing protein n=1 Tax=Corynebacterium halotolerans YIM 70093 = DSM 44683 TaxID=1121362 RepID=M1NP81_9CORY|nr:DUF3806 domain-containing protein [Corynebacterium halotolerans]AGF71322.1 hypothetical protein A605_01540 [Corynebacterium halotolerans YIM 70093 = DSM 44683]
MENSDAPRILALADDEREWLAARLTAAAKAGLLADQEALIDSFDGSRDDWHARPLGERGSAAMLVNIYGAAFGQLLSEEFDLEWCVVEREGTDQIGLYGAAGRLVFFPLQTVAQRWEDPAQRSLADLLAQARESLRAVQGEG